MMISRLAKSPRQQNLPAALVVMAVAACFGLASFVVNPPLALAETVNNSQTQHESETTPPSPNNYNYRMPLPLIVSRPLPAPSSASPETTGEPDTQSAPEISPRERPVETDSGNIEAAVELQASEVSSGPLGESVTTISLEAAPINQPAGPLTDPTQTSLGASSTRAVLWGIVASMSTLLVLGSLIFWQAESETGSTPRRLE